MPAVTSAFLAALNGTTHDPQNDAAVTSPASGSRNLYVDLGNELYMTTSNGPFKIGALAHQLLSAQGAQPGPGGNGMVLQGVAYSVTINAATSYIEVQQSSP